MGPAEGEENVVVVVVSCVLQSRGSEESGEHGHSRRRSVPQGGPARDPPVIDRVEERIARGPGTYFGGAVPWVAQYVQTTREEPHRVPEPVPVVTDVPHPAG